MKVTTKFLLYDTYEGDEELIAECETMDEVKKAARNREKETDGEWYPLLQTRKEVCVAPNIFTMKWVNVYNWTY